MRSSRFVMLAVLALGGCYRSHEVAVEAESRFTGRWLILDTVFRATSGGSVHDFWPDGTVELVEIWALGPAGGVSDPATGRSCEFAGPWSAEGAVLTIGATCSDGTPRDVALEFGDASSNATGNVVEIVSVGDEHGWRTFEHTWEWAWFHCDRGDPDDALIAACLD
jgi:hypothetical protein